jgi:hypothetical protein
MQEFVHQSDQFSVTPRAESTPRGVQAGEPILSPHTSHYYISKDLGWAGCGFQYKTCCSKPATSTRLPLEGVDWMMAKDLVLSGCGFQYMLTLVFGEGQ